MQSVRAKRDMSDKGDDLAVTEPVDSAKEVAKMKGMLSLMTQHRDEMKAQADALMAAGHLDGADWATVASFDDGIVALAMQLNRMVP